MAIDGARLSLVSERVAYVEVIVAEEGWEAVRIVSGISIISRICISASPGKLTRVAMYLSLLVSPERSMILLSEY